MCVPRGALSVSYMVAGEDEIRVVRDVQCLERRNERADKVVDGKQRPPARQGKSTRQAYASQARTATLARLSCRATAHLALSCIATLESIRWFVLCSGGIIHRSAQRNASERAVPPLRVACCMSKVSCAVPALPVERIRARCLLVRHRRLLPDQPVVVRTRDVPVGRARSTHVREERRVVVPAVRPAVTDRPCRAPSA